MSETLPSRLPVFVCYAHEDNDSKKPRNERWLDRLLQQLAPLAIQDQVCAWSDKDIENGQDWHQRIQLTLENVKAAVLLVSPAFLASTYIRNSEIPVLLKNAQNRGVVIIPVIVRHCLFKETTFKYPDSVHGPEKLSLASLQSANSPSIPLNSMSEHEQDKVLLEVTQSLLGILGKSSSQPTPVEISSQLIWNVPLGRNPFFTGREDILEEIREALLSSSKAAFSGLGGIGKTQTAVEFAYRHKENYSQILWVKAESQQSLTSDFAQLATMLNLAEQKAQDQEEVIKAVQRWLQQHDQWLLIFDNADELNLIHPFLQGLQSGHVLLTTRAQATTIFNRVEVKELPNDEAILFLLRRAKLVDPNEITLENVPQNLHKQALGIVTELAALTLALDQAGAYIEENQCGLDVYLEIYKTHGIELLKERGLFAPGHPDPVATTWALSYQKIEEANPAAAELLRFCSFLSPDAIPEELITQGASEFGEILGPVAKDHHLFNKAIGDILKYSLIHRDMNTKTFDIHRLVQAVIQNSLNEETKIPWIEQVIRAMNLVFPEVDFHNWPQCDRLLPQAQHCASIIMGHKILLPEAAGLLNGSASYLDNRARYREAEPLYQRALAIREEVLGPIHPDVATSLNNLALLYKNQGKYSEAEPLYQRALAILEATLGLEHSNTKAGRENYKILLKKMEEEKD